MTGVVDDRRVTLEREDGCFALFEWAWQQQDTWSLDVHAGFWRGALRLWPVRRGRPSVTGRLAWAVHRAGSIDAAADALNRAPDDLRRQLERTEEPPPTSKPVITAYVLPRVYAGREPPPDIHAYPNFDMGALPTDPVTRQIAAALEQSAMALDALLADLAPALTPHGIDGSTEPEHMWQVLEAVRAALDGDDGLRDMLVTRGMAPAQAAAVIGRSAVRRRSLDA